MFGGGGSPTAGPIAGPTATSTGSKLASAAKWAAPFAKWAGVAGTALDTGLGIHDLWNGKEQTELSGLDYISPMRLGMRAGKSFNDVASWAMGGNDSIGTKLESWFGNSEEIGRQMVAPTPVSPRRPSVPVAPSTDTGEIASKLQEKLGTNETPTGNKPPPSQLLSSEAKADSTSPIGLQLAKMDDSNKLLQQMTQLATKQLETAEKQLAAMIVSDEDKQQTFKLLSSGNKFVANYNTPV